MIAKIIRAILFFGVIRLLEKYKKNRFPKVPLSCRTQKATFFFAQESSKENICHPNKIFELTELVHTEHVLFKCLRERDVAPQKQQELNTCAVFYREFIQKLGNLNSKIYRGRVCKRVFEYFSLLSFFNVQKMARCRILTLFKTSCWNQIATRIT